MILVCTKCFENVIRKEDDTVMSFFSTVIKKCYDNIFLHDGTALLLLRQYYF